MKRMPAIPAGYAHKLRPVFEEGWISAVQTFMQPPYTRFSHRIVDLMVWMKS